MNKAEITQAQLAAWSESYRACPQRKLAALALGKTDLNEVAFVPEGAWKMRQKFSVEIRNAGGDLPAGFRPLLAVCRDQRAARAHRQGTEAGKIRAVARAILAFWDKFERCELPAAER